MVEYSIPGLVRNHPPQGRLAGPRQIRILRKHL